MIEAVEYQMEQRSDEWFEIRLGKVTASRLKDILAITKAGKEAAGRRNYRAELVVERLTKKKYDRHRSAAMEWGQDTEELARTQYMLRSGNYEVRESGFFQHNKLMVGASPDGLIGDDGCLEIKCRNTANHIEALRTNQVPTEYLPQIQGQLWMTGRRWCDFVSFDPDMPPNAQILIRRVNRDDVGIAMMQEEVIKFLKEVDEEENFIRNYTDPMEVPF